MKLERYKSFYMRIGIWKVHPGHKSKVKFSCSMKIANMTVLPPSVIKYCTKLILFSLSEVYRGSWQDDDTRKSRSRRVIQLCRKVGHSDIFKIKIFAFVWLAEIFFFYLKTDNPNLITGKAECSKAHALNFCHWFNF